MSQAVLTADRKGTNLRTVSIPGFAVSPVLILTKVPKPTPESSASLSICSYVKAESHAFTSDAAGSRLSFMGVDSSRFERLCLPISEGVTSYSSDMGKTTSLLWANINNRMAELKTNSWQLAIKAGVGAATLQRIKDGETSTRLDKVTDIAGALGVPAWRLLQPRDDQFSMEALELAQSFEQIKDKSERTKALQICRLVLLGQVPATAPEMPAALHADAPAPAPVSPTSTRSRSR